MASFSDNSDWGADIENNASYTAYPNDGSDYCGDDSSSNYRVPNKFTISTLPTTDTVSQVDFDIYVSAVTGASSSTWIIGPYGGDGQANPESDSGVTRWNRCDVSSDNYVTGITAYRTTGQKNHTNLGSAANTDMEAARDAGTIFSLAIRMTTEGSASDRCEFREYTHGTTPPSITVTHAAAAGATGKANPLSGPLGGPLSGPLGL